MREEEATAEPTPVAVAGEALAKLCVLLHQGLRGVVAANSSSLFFLPHVSNSRQPSNAVLLRADVPRCTDDSVMHPCFCPRTGERKSKRARKGRGPMMVSSTTKLGEVKLRLIEVLGLHPSNAALYVRGSLVEGDDHTMAGGLHIALLGGSASGCERGCLAEGIPSSDGPCIW